MEGNVVHKSFAKGSGGCLLDLLDFGLQKKRNVLACSRHIAPPRRVLALSA